MPNDPFSSFSFVNEDERLLPDEDELLVLLRPLELPAANACFLGAFAAAASKGSANDVLTLLVEETLFTSDSN